MKMILSLFLLFFVACSNDGQKGKKEEPAQVFLGSCKQRDECSDFYALVLSSELSSLKSEIKCPSSMNYAELMPEKCAEEINDEYFCINEWDNKARSYEKRTATTAHLTMITTYKKGVGRHQKVDFEGACSNQRNPYNAPSGTLHLKRPVLLPTAE